MKNRLFRSYARGFLEEPRNEISAEKGKTMHEIMVRISIEPFDEGGYLATSRELEGLIAQGRTLAETMEIAEGSPNYALRGPRLVFLHKPGCL